MRKKWKVYESISKKERSKFPEIDPLLLQLLFNRGLKNPPDIEQFLSPDYQNDLHDPMTMPGVKAAVERILLAIEKKQKVLVYGDYDADGVCSSALMVLSLKAFGIKPGIYIPYRDTEGYGMNERAVLEIANQGYNLVITVDCGIANYNEVEILKKRGVETIITDHHNPVHTIPDSLAVVNPKLEQKKMYKNQELSGTAVAFKLIAALLSSEMRKKWPNITFPHEGFEKWLLDLVAISLVTDVCQLTGENRTLMKYGLLVLSKTQRKGLLSLARESRIDLNSVTAQTIGFQIGPRLNAAGRMDHASTSYQLLVTEDESEAINLSSLLNEKNRERQALTEQIFKEVLEQTDKQKEDPVFIVKKSDWQTGLVGLVAGKISDKYYKPTIVIGKNLDGNWVGSGRSIPEIDITEALKVNSKYLSHFGGHAQACGFTLKKEKDFDGFKKGVMLFMADKLKGIVLTPKITVDVEIELKDVNWSLVDGIEKFKPFGPGNPVPSFISRKVIVNNVVAVGQNNNHLKIDFKARDGTIKRTIAFQCDNESRWGKNWVENLKLGDEVDIVFEIQINEWNGNREIQLTINDMKLSD